MLKHLLIATCIAALAAGVTSITAPTPAYAEGVCDATEGFCKHVSFPEVCTYVPGFGDVCVPGSEMDFTGEEAPY